MSERSKIILPLSGVSSPAIIRKVVVFPQPDGPRSPKNSPRSTAKETSATAAVEPYRFDMCSKERKGIKPQSAALAA